MVTFGRKTYLSVSHMPLSSSWSRKLLAVRLRTVMTLPSLIRQQVEEHQHARRQHDEAERERQEHLPAEAHQLVVAVAREGRTHPQEAEGNEADLHREPDAMPD